MPLEEARDHQLGHRAEDDNCDRDAYEDLGHEAAFFRFRRDGALILGRTPTIRRVKERWPSG